MKKRIFSSVLVMLMVLLAITSNVTAKDEESKLDVPPEIQEEMKKSSSGAYAIECFLKEIEMDLKFSYDDIYGGSWLDYDTFEPYVSLTEITDLHYELSKKYGIKLVEAKYSFVSLVSEQEELHKKYGDLVVSSYTDEINNRLVVEIFDEKFYEQMISSTSKYSSGMFMIEKVENEQTYEEEAVIKGGHYMDPPGCSVGFVAYSGKTAGFTTAGHCGTNGTSFYYSSSKIGATNKRVYDSTADAAWVKLSGSNSVTKTTYNGWPYTAVTSSGSGVVVNAQVMIFGKGSYVTCKLTSTSVQGNGISNLMQTNCGGKTTGGWSGGLVLNAYQSSSAGGSYNANGIHLGSNSTHTYIMKSTVALSKLGLTAHSQ